MARMEVWQRKEAAGTEKRRRGHFRSLHLRTMMSFPWVYPRRLSVGLGKAATPKGKFQLFQCVPTQKGLQSLPFKLF